MKYKILEWKLIDSEGIVVEKKWEIKKKFLKFFWKHVDCYTNANSAVSRVQNLLKEDLKAKCKWTKSENSLISLESKEPKKTSLAKRDRQNKEDRNT